MTPPLTRKLLVVTGKGGVGKSTIAAALGLLAARSGRRTIVVEVGGRRALPELFGAAPGQRQAEVSLAPGLWSTSVDPDRALLDWLAAIGGSLPARLLASRATFRCFAAAVPGARELLSLVKVWELSQERPPGKRTGYDQVILDAPATGHALAMLRSPATFASIAPVGPIAAQAREMRELLGDPQRCSYLAVAQGSEMAATETVELSQQLGEALGRSLDSVIVNATFPRRFSREDLEALERLDGGPLVEAAARAAHFVQRRARTQQSQIARLRRQRLAVLAVPYLFLERMDRAALELIADRLARA